MRVFPNECFARARCAQSTRGGVAHTVLQRRRVDLSRLWPVLAVWLTAGLASGWLVGVYQARRSR
jgi:hypothetical protein